MSTQHLQKSDVDREWVVLDCAGQPLGRLATKIANLIRGKHRPSYSPHVDTGDFVVAINAEKIVLTGRKEDQKMYWRHSGYPGGIKGITARQLRETKPEDLLKKAVKGMLPGNKLSRQVIRKLKIYTGAEHPHQAQLSAAAQEA